MLIITVYALIGEDLKIICFKRDADHVFTGLNAMSFGVFCIEIILACIAKPEYFNSFFFWLDLVSTLSLLTDIEPVWSLVTGSGSDVNQGEADATETAALARASRGARIGTRAGRMTRVFRMIRLIRIVKLYKSANQAITTGKNDNVSEI